METGVVDAGRRPIEEDVFNLISFDSYPATTASPIFTNFVPKYACDKVRAKLLVPLV